MPTYHLKKRTGPKALFAVRLWLCLFQSWVSD